MVEIASGGCGCLASTNWDLKCTSFLINAFAANSPSGRSENSRPQVYPTEAKLKQKIRQVLDTASPRTAVAVIDH